MRKTHALRWRKKREVRRGREVFILEKFAKRDGANCVCIVCLGCKLRLKLNFTSTSYK